MATLYWFIAGAIIGIGVGGIISVAWAPLLKSTRLQSVFGAGPLRSWRSNYTGWFVVLGMAHTGILVALMQLYGSPGVALDLIMRVSLGFALMLWLVAGVILPVLAGTQDLRTAAVTGVGAVWYAALMTGIPYAGYLLFIL